MRSLLLSIPIVAVALVPGSRPVQGCAAAPRHGEFVGVNAEEAVILYDAATKTEHFIRRANFRTEAKDFGFLVPTPAKPELGETNAGIFQTLHSATAPRHVPSGRTQRIVMKRNQPESAAKAGAMPRGPDVLDERKNLAGYDVVVLRADDLAGLKKWLEERDYDARPALMDWLKWYVENKWIISAFKVSKAAESSHDRWAKSVRMSFATETPFYPYREPQEKRENAPAAPRSLRVFFLGEQRIEGTLGKNEPWHGRTVWANACPEYTAKSVVQGLGMAAKETDDLAAKKWFLTEFEDHSSPRPGTDEVFFGKAKEQATVERPVIYYDQYEYVYEDEAKEPLTPEETKKAEERAQLWMIVGILTAAIVLTAGGGVLALKRRGR